MPLPLSHSSAFILPVGRAGWIADADLAGNIVAINPDCAPRGESGGEGGGAAIEPLASGAQISLGQLLATLRATEDGASSVRFEIAPLPSGFRVMAVEANQTIPPACLELLDGLSLGVLTFGEDGRIEQVNAALCRMLGVEPSSLVGRRWREFVAPEQLKIRWRRRSGAYGWGVFQLEFAGAAGSVWTRVEVCCALEGGGDPTPILAVVHDISGRKAAERRAEASQKRFRIVTETIRDVFWMSDPRLETGYYVSPAYAEIWGRSIESFYDDPRSFMEAIHPDYVERVGQGLKRQAAGEPFSHEYEIVRPDGTTRWIWDRGFPVRLPGEAAIYVGLAQDITEKKRAEGLIAEARRLEAMALMTGELAHDFNNLLNIISLQTSELLSLGPDPAAAAGLSKIAEASQRATCTMRSLLAASQRQKLEHAPADLNALILEQQAVLASSAGAAVDLRLELGEHPAVARVDARAFANALLSLVANAREAMPGGGRLLIRSRLVSRAADAGDGMLKPGSYVAVEVVDEGVGMSSAVAARAFDAFFTTKPGGFGLGLGLSTVYGMARQSEGLAEIESTEGEGTCIRILLPAIKEAPASARARTLAAPESEISILVVDDETDLLEAIVAQLRRAGFQAVGLSNGAEAVARLEREPFTLLLTDIVMRPLSGLDLAAEAAERWPAMRILMMSGFVSASRRRNVAWPVVEKPLSSEGLIAAVRSALQSKSDVRPQTLPH